MTLAELIRTLVVTQREELYLLNCAEVQSAGGARVRDAGGMIVETLRDEDLVLEAGDISDETIKKAMMRLLVGEASEG